MPWKGGYASLKEVDKLKNFNYKSLHNYTETELNLKLEEIKNERRKTLTFITLTFLTFGFN